MIELEGFVPIVAVVQAIVLRFVEGLVLGNVFERGGTPVDILAGGVDAETGAHHAAAQLDVLLKLFVGDVFGVFAQTVGDHLADIGVSAKALIARGDVEVVVQGRCHQPVVEVADIESDGAGALADVAIGLAVDHYILDFTQPLESILDELALLFGDQVHTDLAEGVE